MKPVFTVLLAVVFSISPSFSQTILTAGGIALLGVNCDNPDDFAFLLLVDIEAGTVIKFTDNGWLAAGGFRTGEGIQTYTASASINAGTVIVFSQHPADFSASGSFALASTGDQLLAYQGPENSPVMIYALNIAGAGIWQSDASNTNTSALPAGLLNGESAVAVQEYDNVKFGGLTHFSTPLAALLTIGDKSNWLGDDLNRFDLTSFGDFSLPVHLSSFTARAGDGIVTLQWITESEKDNAGFEILRAVAGDSSYLLLSSYIHNPALRGQLSTNTRTIYKFEDRLVANEVSYWYQLVDVEVNGKKNFHGPVTATPHAAGGEVTNSGMSNLPESFVLHPNFPNPFNPSTTLRFDIPQLSSNLPEVSLTVFNTLGQRVRLLFQGHLPAGHYSLDWEGTDDKGIVMPGGSYYAVLKAGYLTRTVQMVYLK